MFARHPVEGLEDASHTAFETFSLDRKQLDNGAGNRLIRMKYTE
jgi:hypothetical protein